MPEEVFLPEKSIPSRDAAYVRKMISSGEAAYVRNRFLQEKWILPDKDEIRLMRYFDAKLVRKNDAYKFLCVKMTHKGII